MRVVAVRALRLDAARGAVAAEVVWNGAWRSAAASGLPNPQAHPHVRAWREAMKAAGAPHKDFPSSIEALLRRALKGGEPFRINPLVDFYNSVSLRNVSPAGGFDVDALTEGLELRLSRPGDRFAALDGSPSVELPAGEVSYASGVTVLTRHLLWRQSRHALVSAATHDALFLAEIPAALGDELGRAMQADLERGLREDFGGEVEARWLDAERPDWQTAGGR
ncbi:MAG: B3/4 domain-containing protein [Acidobacteriota bacterium]